MGVITVLIPAKPPTRFIPASINPPRRLLKINQNKNFKGFLKIIENAVTKTMPNRKITAIGTFENKKPLPLNSLSYLHNIKGSDFILHIKGRSNIFFYHHAGFVGFLCPAQANKTHIFFAVNIFKVLPAIL